MTPQQALAKMKSAATNNWLSDNFGYADYLTGGAGEAVTRAQPSFVTREEACGIIQRAIKADPYTFPYPVKDFWTVTGSLSDGRTVQLTCLVSDIDYAVTLIGTRLVS
jgi:hypothetical protein